ncbi:hypothetical protein DL766_002415 [Monosporascus sp. MC13-8B]|uniref:Uncharacterized protein n=1 Tax=Monosporascus cannonballus TaxID=155416 RepID=A0ABY0HER0_9PEZI|nr:hypothetical protein DL762_001996 [Monosporascus cannonballus]RYO97120.1 hypothetical protein DL763_002910 [Monosporascus cannonballus]RYP35682.1 hypothetical protein DL766_002415 [Monosporascus sp. MC13-8B]
MDVSFTTRRVGRGGWAEYTLGVKRRFPREDTASEPELSVEVAAVRYVTDGFPAPVLTRIQRHITGHDGPGKSVFLRTNDGDQHRVTREKQAVANIIYSTLETPVVLNGDVDIRKVKEKEPPLHYHNGSIARMIGFGPGLESPLHRAVSLDYGIVIEGVFEFELDSG